MPTGLKSSPDDFDLRMSEDARPFYNKVVEFLDRVVDPMQKEFFKAKDPDNRWGYTERQLELLEGAKNKAKEEGLWNFFLPDTGQGLSNLDYAYLATELGKYPLGSESLNCSAPDTGNMEVLERVGTPAQKETMARSRCCDGEIRSCLRHDRSRPVASSDARNISTARPCSKNGDEWVINGEKYYISGAGDPRCKIMILHGARPRPTGRDRTASRAQILVPLDTPGVEIVGPMCVFGHDEAPHGHMHIRLTDVRVPERPTSCSARGADSRSASFASVRAASITACGRSARRRRRSTSWSAGAQPARASASH